mmetsp:Transcript_7475/g.16092  ORF Transcript_7475/g.16092 Transcript_7475/m.16092 type:complete len:95 (-) Transcript_7475:1701-1985(-)
MMSRLTSTQMIPFRFQVIRIDATARSGMYYSPQVKILIRIRGTNVAGTYRYHRVSPTGEKGERLRFTRPLQQYLVLVSEESRQRNLMLVPEAEK